MSMSALTNKNALIIGLESSLLNSVIRSLESHGVTVSRRDCEEITSDLLNEHSIDFVILNNLQRKETCASAIHLMRGTLIERAIPVFVLVNDDPEEISRVLTLGAADYITTQEDVHSVLEKIEALFGQSDQFAGSGAIDITPTEASLSTTGIRVFVIEDDPLLRNLLSIKLNRSLFPCEFSNDGSNVIPLMHHFKPDVIILDLMLPGRSGFEVMAEVKADDTLKDIPIIIFSNRDGQEDRQKAQELGASGFYVKAMTDLSELIETIESLVK